ncbi:MAG: hypothetical protein HC923_02405 [Myxococcales bacterium]|nr:hypothetical protein [Myxococcales bacterium]
MTRSQETMGMKRAIRGLVTVLAMAAIGCSRLLGLPTDENHPFEHRSHVTEGIACTKCHAGMDEAGEDGPLHLPTKEVCLECHQEPHDTNECSNCHGEDFTPIRTGMAKHYLKFSHAEHLVVPETSGNCARCHQDVKYKDSSLLPKMPVCLSCHEHERTWEIAECDSCHVNIQAEMPKPASHIVHEEDYAQNHSTDAAANRAVCATCHSESQCASCHGVNVPVLPYRLNFDRPELGGLHRAGFRSRHGREALVDGALCVTCHTESSCVTCHAEVGLAADGSVGTLGLRNPHPTNGWVDTSPGPQNNQHGVAARQDPVSCAGCHSGAGEQLCVDCHRVGGVGGNIHPPGFDSSLDAQRDQPCTMCHTPTGGFGISR